MKIAVWAFILVIIGCILIGGIAGFFGARAYFKNYLKKNPPITEKQIRAMMSQMGRNPSEKQVRQVMKSMNEAR